mgnify:CR=1 FL=1
MLHQGLVTVDSLRDRAGDMEHPALQESVPIIVNGKQLRLDKSSEAYARLRKQLQLVTYAREVAKEKQQAFDFEKKEKG